MHRVNLTREDGITVSINIGGESSAEAVARIIRNLGERVSPPNGSKQAAWTSAGVGLVTVTTPPDQDEGRAALIARHTSFVEDLKTELPPDPI